MSAAVMELTGARSVDGLAAEIVSLAGRLAAVTCRWLLLVARFDAADGAALSGLGSTAAWLSLHCGVARRTAVEQVRVARALARFPVLADGMGAGRLSYSQVRAISRVPDRVEEPASAERVVADLVELAPHGSASQLEVMVRGLRTAADSARLDAAGQAGTETDAVERAAEGVPEAYVSTGWTGTGQWRCSARLVAEDGAVLDTALDRLAAAEQLSRPQALVRMAEIALAALADAENPPRQLRGEEKTAIVIHLDAAAMPPADQIEVSPRSAERGDDVATPPADQVEVSPRSAERGGDRSVEAWRPSLVSWARPFGRLADGPGLPAAVVRRLACACRVRLATHDEQGQVIDVGTSARVVTDRQMRILTSRYGGRCAFPGCRSKHRLQAHHVRHWFDGGRTVITNLILLCERHHHAHHDGEYTITPTRVGGRFAFARRDGTPLDPVPLTDEQPHRPVQTEHHDVPVDAADTSWNGDRLDHDYAVTVLATRRAGARAAGGA